MAEGIPRYVVCVFPHLATKRISRGYSDILDFFNDEIESTMERHLKKRQLNSQ